MAHMILHTGEALLSGLLAISPGMAQTPNDNLHQWQVRRLMQPTPAELDKERSGNVYIYDGLSEREVESALDTHFERIERMMFVGTVKAAPAGGTTVESGGCSSGE